MDMLFLCMPRDFLFDNHFKDLGGGSQGANFFSNCIKGLDNCLSVCNIKGGSIMRELAIVPNPQIPLL